MRDGDDTVFDNSADLLLQYICTNCHLALFADHPLNEKWLKCISCGYCKEKVSG